MKDIEKNFKLVESKRVFKSVDWDSIKQLFYTNNWKWGHAKLGIPNEDEIKEFIGQLIYNLEELIMKNGLPKEDEQPYEVSSGRFTIYVDDCGIMEISVKVSN